MLGRGAVSSGRKHSRFHGPTLTQEPNKLPEVRDELRNDGTVNPRFALVRRVKTTATTVHDVHQRTPATSDISPTFIAGIEDGQAS